MLQVNALNTCNTSRFGLVSKHLENAKKKLKIT